jgi:hypothetical protein
MSEIRSYGIKSLMVGDIPDDATMGTVLAALGLTYQDSASLKEADPAVTDIFSEEEDFAVESFQQTGQYLLSWSIMDYTPATLLVIKGGAVTTVNGNDTWSAPNAAPNIEKCIQIITKKNLLIEIPRVQLRAVINMAMKKKGIDLLDIKAPIMQPNNVAVEAISISPYAVPTVSAGPPQNVEVATHIATLTGTATPFRGTATYLWTVKSQPVASAAVIMATPTALVNDVTVLTTVGEYIFTLTVTDSNGFVNSADVTITITA